MRKVGLILLVMFVGGCMTAAERQESPCLAPATVRQGRPANIILVTDVSTSEVDYIAFLKNLYGDDSNIEVISEKYSSPLDATRIAELRAADLVIVSRRTWSDEYCSAKDISIWNDLTTPLILHNPYLAESWGRWEWFKDAMKGDAPWDFTHVGVVDAKDPIFDGVVIAKGQVKVYDPPVEGVDVIDCSSVGNGTLIARPAGVGSSVMIARWAAGTKFYEGSKQTIGGPRIAFFMLKNDKTSITEVSMPKLTADGKKMLENALTSLLASPN